MDLIEMSGIRWDTSPKAVAFVLFFMSMWSVGVAVERIFTFTQAR